MEIIIIFLFIQMNIIFTEAEILALHVQLDGITKKKSVTKDASTQVYLGKGKKTKSKSKYVLCFNHANIGTDRS